MNFRIEIAPVARRDLGAIRDYISDESGMRQAEAVISRIVEKIATLDASPLRGAIPKEFDELGIHRYRQTLILPYRIFYEVKDDMVSIVLIADGRRDIQAVLAQRLLRR